jgi:hypothetical protein
MVVSLSASTLDPAFDLQPVRAIFFGFIDKKEAQ